MLYEIFFSPQVKQSVVVSNKHGIYELPHETRNNVRLRKDQENLKTSYSFNLLPSLSPKPRIFLMLAKNCWKIEMKVSPYRAISYEN